MSKLSVFTFFFLAALSFMLLREDNLPTKEEKGGMFERRSIGAAEASIATMSTLTCKSESFIAIDKIDTIKGVKKVDSTKTNICSVSVEKKTKRVALKIPPKPKITRLLHWKDRKRKYIKMSVGQRKKLFFDFFGHLIVERCVAEGLASPNILNSEQAIKMYMDTSTHADVLFSLPAIESGYNPFVKNDSSSARGFYQFINSTGRNMCKELGIPKDSYDPFNPYQNVVLGVHLYANSFKKFRSVNWAIGAHHDGEGGVYDTNRVYGGAHKNPFTVSVRGAMKIEYQQYPEEAYEQWQQEVMSYNCLECIDYYASLEDTTKIDVADTTLTDTNISKDTIMIPLLTKEKYLAVNRTFF